MQQLTLGVERWQKTLEVAIRDPDHIFFPHAMSWPDNYFVLVVDAIKFVFIKYCVYIFVCMKH